MTSEQVPRYLAGEHGDPLMTGVAILLVIAIVTIGVLYFKLHAVPDRIAHGKNHSQLQLIAMLTLLALFTHNTLFWVAALVVAVVQVPDFLAPLKSIARSLQILARHSAQLKDNANEERE